MEIWFVWAFLEGFLKWMSGTCEFANYLGCDGQNLSLKACPNNVQVCEKKVNRNNKCIEEWQKPNGTLTCTKWRQNITENFLLNSNT